MLQTKTNADYYLRTQNKGNIRIFSLADGTYHVKIDDNDIVKVNNIENENKISVGQKLFIPRYVESSLCEK